MNYKTFVRNKFAITVFGLLISMVFIVPLFIQPYKLTVSTSTDYSFNNIIAILIVLILVLVSSIVYLKSYSSQTALNTIEHIFDQSDSKFKLKHFYIVCAVFLTVIGVFYLIGADYNYGEANYFLLRIDRIKLGEVPYVNFEFAYGPLLLYIPVLLGKILNLSTIGAYYLTYAFFNCFGLFFLHFVINFFNINAKAKKQLFYSIALCSIPFCLGINYTLVRFITPIASFIIIDRVLKKQNSSAAYHVLTTSAICFILVMLALGISIEVGIAMALSIFSYFALSFLFMKDFKSFTILVIYTLLLIIFSLFFNKNLVLILKVFASGGNNFPVIPAPAILFYIISFLAVNSILFSLILKRKIYFMPVTLLVFNVAMLPGAFGRCDPGHIFWYGLGSFICMWVYLSYNKHPFYKVYKVFFILIFTVGFTLSLLFLYRLPIAINVAKFIAAHTSVRNKLNSGMRVFHLKSNKINTYLDKITPQNNFKSIDNIKAVSVPFDTDEELYLQILDTHKYSPEYYTGNFLNLYTPEQINKKLIALKDEEHVFMIIPKSLYSYKPKHQDEADVRKFMSILFLFPFTYDRRKYSEDLYTPIYSYLRTNYEVIATYDNYYLIRRLSNNKHLDLLIN